MAHNRVARYILRGNTEFPFLVDLGVMSEQGRYQSSYDKFNQNKSDFLEFIGYTRHFPGQEITILDFGCGKILSYFCHVLLSERT